MLSLLIETCTVRGLVAVIENQECVFFAGLPFGLHNSQYVVPKIEEGLHALKIDLNTIDFIAVGAGPGSYTGIRVGAVVAKSLSYACKIPLIGISSLEGFIPDCLGKFAAIIDAKMGGAYVIKGERKGHALEYISHPDVLPIDRLGEELKNVDILVGPSVEELKKKIAAKFPDGSWIWQESGPNPLHMTERAKEKYQRGEFSLDGTLELFYLRACSKFSIG